MNIDIAITLADRHQQPEFGEAVFETFHDVVPEWDPVVTQNASQKSLIVDLTVLAATVVEANLRLAQVLRRVADRLDEVDPITGVRIDVADGEPILA